MAERLAASGAAGRLSQVSADDRASLSARILAYCLDSIVLFAFTAVFFAIAGSIIMVSSDFGEGTASDEAFTGLIVVLMATMPCWLLLNVFLLRRRGQTVGQYVIGLRVVAEDGSKPETQRLISYWLALHPLVFHPLLGGLWLLFAFQSLSLQSDLLLIVSLALALLSAVAPVAALIFAVIDPEHRALHDRLAGTRVVYVS
jgi:uncharacterized RDD family membrane protein YckC